MFKTLLHGKPGHPAHPPLTDATIGMLTLATALAVLGAVGVAEDKVGPACWLALAAGLIVAAPTAITGFAEWLTIDWGTPRWRTATLHLSAMVVAVSLYGVATWLQWPGYDDGTVTTSGLVLAIAGFVALTTGGWLGGTLVFVHAMRVERAESSGEPASDSVSLRTDDRTPNAV
jgi:uncharacterized membrane protein